MSRRDNWDAEDGMGFAGLVPTAQEKREEAYEERQRKRVDELHAALSATQRDLESANLVIDELSASRGHFQQRALHFELAIAQLQARLDAALTLLADVRDDVNEAFGYALAEPWRGKAKVRGHYEPLLARIDALSPQPAASETGEVK